MKERILEVLNNFDENCGLLELSSALDSLIYQIENFMVMLFFGCIRIYIYLEITRAGKKKTVYTCLI